MARTVEDIKAQMDASYMEAFSLSSDQMSKAGIWRLVRGIVALSIYSLEILFDAFKIEVTALAASTEYGNITWWGNKMLAFQYNYTLTETNGRLAYDTIDESAKVIKYVSVRDVDGVLQIKIATTSGDSLGIINDADTRAAIDSYVNTIKPAGVATQVISNNADKLAFVTKFVFDAKLDRTDFIAAVKTQIKQYLKSIEFDGAFRINKFRDSLESVPGMIEVYISEVKWMSPDAVSYTDITLTANHYGVSGYFNYIDADSVLTFEGV
jgi:hypothetical protein